LKEGIVVKRQKKASAKKRARKGQLSVDDKAALAGLFAQGSMMFATLMCCERPGRIDPEGTRPIQDVIKAAGVDAAEHYRRTHRKKK
jgi:hypothetical protein